MNSEASYITDNVSVFQELIQANNKKSPNLR